MAEPLAALVDGRPADRLPLTDRAIHYGHGVFETLRLSGATAPLWDHHRSRLARGVERLGLDLDLARIESEWRGLAELPGVGLIKLIVTAADSGRGYGYPARTGARRVVIGYPAPDHATANYRGITVRLCDTRMSPQPALAGIKHLNRLEQVLARMEWHDESVAEGLMRDADERLIEGTMSNLFLITREGLTTPSLARCGVAGVMREVLLEHCPDTTVSDLTLDDLATADAGFVCNSVFGIWPIRHVLGVEFTAKGPRAGRMTRDLQAFLEQEFGYPKAP